MALPQRTVNVEAELHGAPPRRETVSDQTALARVEQTAGQMIRDPQTLAARIRAWQQDAHVLTPAIQVSSIAPGHAVNVAVVVLDAHIDDRGFGTDTYGNTAFLKGEERALSKVALVKIAQAAGISWVPEYTGRVDDRKTPNLWEYRAVGVYTAFDGQIQTIEGTVEIDLRDGSPQIGGWTPEAWAQIVEANKRLPKDKQTWNIGGWSDKRVLQARQFGLRLAEAKAMNAAIRSLGLRQKYSARELEKPFVVLRTSYVPDMSDPAERQAWRERALTSNATLYPGSRRLQAPDVIDVEPQRTEEPQVDQQQSEQQEQANDQGASQSSAQASTEKQAQQKPAEPPANTPRITEVRDIKKGKRGNGSTWTLRAIKLSDGREGTTLDDKVAELAEQLCRENAPVEILIEAVVGNDQKTYRNVTELRRWQPGLYDQVGDGDGEPY